MKLYELDLQPGQKQDYHEPGVDKTAEFARLIQKDCSEALAAMRAGGQFLYRGLKSQELRAFKGASRTDRVPLSTKAHHQLMLDQMLTEFGFKAIRSNSIYCISDISEAQYYTKMVGMTYMIFPINGFDYTWSVYSGDLYAMMGASEYKKLENGDWEEIQEKYQFTNKHLNKAIEKGHEVMVHGQYYAFSVKHYQYEFYKLLLGKE